MPKYTIKEVLNNLFIMYKTFEIMIHVGVQTLIFLPCSTMLFVLLYSTDFNLVELGKLIMELQKEELIQVWKILAFTALTIKLILVFLKHGNFITQILFNKRVYAFVAILITINYILYLPLSKQPNFSNIAINLLLTLVYFTISNYIHTQQLTLQLNKEKKCQITKSYPTGECY